MIKKVYTKLSEQYADFKPRTDSIYDRIPSLGYETIVNSLGVEDLVAGYMGSYQGDNLWLVRHTASQELGYLIFGYGSCSGCDWLEGCDSFEELDDLQDSMWSNIQWIGFTNEDALAWFEDRDWGIEDRWYGEDLKTFLTSVKAYLKGETVDEEN